LETVTLSLTGVPADYIVVLSDETFDLGPGDSKDVTLTLTVPVDEDSGSHIVGGLVWTVGTTEHPINIKTNVKSMLDIKDLDVVIDGSSEDVDDGEETERIAPGMEVELELNYENLFDGDYRHGDLDNVELTVELANLEDDAEDFFGDEDDELDLTEDCDDIDADENDGEITVSFDIPTEAEEESYDLLIRLEAEDENGATHTVEWIITLDVDREKDDVRIDKADLTMDTVFSGGETTLVIKLRNYGSNDQDDVVLSVFNEALGLNVQEMNIELDKDPDDKDNDFTKRIPIALSEGVLAGTFTIEVRVYVDGDEEVDHRILKLTVAGAETVEEDEEEEGDVIVQTLPEETLGDGLTGSVVSTVETSQSGGMTAFMVVVIVLLVVLIALMLGVLIRK
jgi:hypothetical protein